jgi:cobalt/nickel transport system permease protein
MTMFSDCYREGHPVSKIDARVKLVFTLAVLAMVLSYKGFFFPLLVLACCLAACLYIKVPLRLFFLRFSEPLFIGVVLVLLKFFFTGTETLFSVKLAGIQISGHSDGLRGGLLIACRMMGAVSVVALLGFSTPFTGIVAALAWLRVPKALIEISMFAYRYIFMLFEDAMVIYCAQKNRLGYSTIRRGVSSFGVLAGSLTLKAFEHSQSTTVAMVQRGYDGTMPVLKHKPFKTAEVIASVFVIVIMGVLWKIA